MFSILALILPEPPTGTPADIAKDGLEFFETWIARIGGIIAFIGAVKFALSMKDDDSKEQLHAILTMISGFMIVSAVRNLSVFDIPDYYSSATANMEFISILDFISKWIRRVGAFALFTGAVAFGFSIKESNAAGKVTSLKTISAGSLAMALSAVISTFAYM